MAQGNTEDSFRNVEWTSLRGRRIISAFVTGVLFSLLVVVAGLYLNPNDALEFAAGRYQFLFVGLFIGVSTGHYLGISIGDRADINIAAATGSFLTITLTFLTLLLMTSGLQGMIGPGGTLVIAAFLLVLGHYSLLIEENGAIEDLIEQFAERISPILLGIIWLGEAIFPPILQAIFPHVGLSDVGGALLTGIEVAAAVLGVAVAVWIISRVQEEME